MTIYPRFALNVDTWVDAGLGTAVLDRIDGEGLPRTDDWCPGDETAPPSAVLERIGARPMRVSRDLRAILDRAAAGDDLREEQIVRLIRARGDDFNAVVQAADELRRGQNGDTVSYVVNRNINYTNICYFKCQFCAFSKGKLAENLRGRPYDLSHEEIQRRTREAWQRGGTEVCMQGGIHPEYTGETYVGILHAVKEAVPEMHIHAFSPLEVWQGAATANLSLEDYLGKLKGSGLGTLPGTAAEILDDEIRAVICPDKINTSQWLEVMETAPPGRFPHHGDDHVRPCRPAQALGAAPDSGTRPAEANGWIHRVRTAALRSHGSAVVPEGPGPQGADVPRGDPGPRRGPARPRSVHHQHPGKLGQARPRRRRRRVERRLQRPRRPR